MVLVDFNGLAIGSIMGSLNRGEGLSENLVKHIILNKNEMEDSRYKTYRDCSIDELEDIVNDLENMSINALKNKKLDIRKTILGSVTEAKKEIEKRLKK